MGVRRLAVLIMVAGSGALVPPALVSGCGGAVEVRGDGGTGSSSGSSSGGVNSSSSSGGFSSSSSGGFSSSSSGGFGSSSGGGSGSSSGGGNDLCSNLPAGACQSPPPAPTGTMFIPSSAAHNYAIHQLFLGDTDRQMNPNMTAWKTFGYNLDGKVTTATRPTCARSCPAPRSRSQVDGNGGIDNSFGSQIMPIVETLDSTATPDAERRAPGGPLDAS